MKQRHPESQLEPIAVTVARFKVPQILFLTIRHAWKDMRIREKHKSNRYICWIVRERYCENGIKNLKLSKILHCSTDLSLKLKQKYMKFTNVQVYMNIQEHGKYFWIVGLYSIWIVQYLLGYLKSVKLNTKQTIKILKNAACLEMPRWVRLLLYKSIG